MRFYRLILAIGWLFITTAPVYAQTSAPTLVTTVEGLKEYELKNGLRVLLIPDQSQSNIVVNIVYKVGSRHEGYGESGMAHLLEHMLFKQCKKFTDIKKAIAEKGAFANGTTWYDRTNYYEVLSASDENLRWALDMEADRMVNSKILPEELQKEFSVVRNEFEIGENSPSGVLNERILSAMYLWHNYGKSTIGSKEDIERVKADNLRAFYRKYYQPDNAVLIIAGKFDEKKALQYVQQYFGPIPRPTRVLQPTYTVEPPQDGERNVVLRRTGDIQYIGMAYHTPSLADPDYAANDALIQILTNDPSGYFYKKLVESKMASKINGYSLSLYDPGFSYFELEVPKEKNLDSVKTEFLKAADNIMSMNFSEEDLTRAKNSLLKYIEDAQAKTINFSIGLTEFIGGGDWRLWFLYRDRIEKLTLSDVVAAARKYYKPSNRTYGVFIPDTAPDRTVVAETPDIAKMLQGYKGKEVAAQKADFENSIANIKKHTEYGALPNGGKYVLLEKPTKGDKINASISLRFGDENSLTNKSEIASIVAQMLKSGTTTRSKKEISDELDRIKTDITISPGLGGIAIGINTDKQNLPAALRLLEDILRNPAFDAAEFEKLILENKATIDANKSDPQTVASEKLAKLSTKYPKGHPAYPASSEEALAELDKVKLEDVKAFYKEFYGANHSLSSFVGELDKPVVKDFLQRTFGSWNSGAKFEAIAPRHFDVQGVTEAINTPDKTNAMLLGSINIRMNEQDPDYPAVFMANELLGGGAFLSSRIPQRLRENEGMSYGAGSYLNSYHQYDALNWGVYAFFNPLYKGRLDSAIHQEIDKAISAGFTKDELDKSVKSLMEQRRTYLGLNNYLAQQLKNYLRDGKDLESFTKFEQQLSALTVEKVNAALRRYFDKKKLIMIYGGDFDKGKTPAEQKAF